MKNKPTDSLSSMLKAVLKFRDERNWAKYHTPKNLAMNLVREASEALEVCLWQTDEQILSDEERKEDIVKELADVLHCLLLFAHTLDIDIVEAFWSKLKELDKRYPASEFTDHSTYDFKKRQKRLKQKNGGVEDN